MLQKSTKNVLSAKIVKVGLKMHTNPTPTTIPKLLANDFEVEFFHTTTADTATFDSLFNTTFSTDPHKLRKF